MKQEANMEHSAEWLRGAYRIASRYAPMDVVMQINVQLAAAEAREKEALATDWEDTDVQAVYRMLGSSELPGPAEEHWEGKVARMVVAHMRSRASEASKAQPSAADVIREAKAALEMVRQYICTHHITYLDRTPDGDRLRAMKHEAREYVESGKHLEALATITAWEAGNVQG